MKKSNRILTIFILSFVIILMNVSIVNAQTLTSQDKLDKLIELKVLLGEGNGVDGNKTMTRYRSIQMLLRLKGYEEDMLTYDFQGKDTFADAEDYNDYHKRLMAYVKNTPDLGIVGFPDGTFRPYQEISAKEYARVLLEALGYRAGIDYTWNTITDLALDLGIAHLSEEIELNKINVYGIGNFTYNILSLNRKNEDITLGEKLGYIVKTAYEELKVTSITPLNLVQTEVTFNKPVHPNTSENINNYTLSTDDKNIAIREATLFEDGLTVVLTHENVGQQTAASLKATNITDIHEQEIINDFRSNEFEYLDIAFPEAFDTEVIGINDVKVTFSEPMNPDTLLDRINYKIEYHNSYLYIKNITVSNNNKIAYLEVYSDLTNGELSLFVKNLKDEAGYQIKPTTLLASIVEDSSSPVVTGYKDASPTSVTLIFNEAIKLDNFNKNNYYHTNINNPVDDIHIDSISNNELTLNFTNYTLPKGTAYIYISKSSISDLWIIKTMGLCAKLKLLLI